MRPILIIVGIASALLLLSRLAWSKSPELSTLDRMRKVCDAEV